jgi:Gpi18-like mannosyltransferase
VGQRLVPRDRRPRVRRTVGGVLPLFPALVYVLGWAIGSNLAAGVLISLAAAAVGAWALVEIAKPYPGGRGEGHGAPVALYPTAFVFTSAYSEGLFLAFAACSFLAAMRGRPWLAGLLGGLAVGTRLIGLALVPALVVLLRPRTRADLLRIAPVVLLPLMGLVAVTLMYDLMVDDALAFALDAPGRLAFAS